MEIRTYIKELLYLHDCVIIPDFGGFVTGYQSSEIHKFRNLVYPPSKTIMFNRRLQANDGILVNYVAQQEKTDYKKAEETVKQFALWWNRLLESKGVVVFPEVGKLYINSANVLIFLPELRKNYLLDTFGLKPIAFQPQMEVVSSTSQGETTTEPLDEAEYAERLRIKRRKKMQLTAAAALAAALFLVPQLFLQNFLPEKIRIGQLNLVEGVQSEKETPLPTEQPKDSADVFRQPPAQESAAEQDKSVSSENSEPLLPSDKSIVPSAGNYYIILGSFDFISDAIRTKKQLDFQWKKTLEVFSSEDGFYLVGIPSGSKENAEASLSEFQKAGLKPRIMAKTSPL